MGFSIQEAKYQPTLEKNENCAVGGLRIPRKMMKK